MEKSGKATNVRWFGALQNLTLEFYNQLIYPFPEADFYRVATGIFIVSEWRTKVKEVAVLYVRELC